MGDSRFGCCGRGDVGCEGCDVGREGGAMTLRIPQEFIWPS